MKKRKDYSELTFTDNFMFCTIMQSDKELCKEVVETILDAKISKIVKPPEKDVAVEITPDGRGVRLDVYFEGDDALYDIEMQTTNEDDLRKRSRYYQSMMDLEYLEKGKSFSELKQGYVIFICTFDLFKKGLSKYTFKNFCLEDGTLGLEDGTAKVFVNIGGMKPTESRKLDDFILYLKNGRVGGQLAEKIEGRLKDARLNKEWRARYMTLDWELASQFRKGKEEGREETVKALIDAGIISPEQLGEVKRLLDEKRDEE